MKEEKNLKQIKVTGEKLEMEEKNKWGETVEGIIKILENVNGAQEDYTYFDPFLNESIKTLEKFVSKYIPQESVEKKDIEFNENVEKIKMNYLKTGFFISKIFLENLFTKEQMQDFQGFIKKLCQFRDEIYEAVSFCDERSPNSESMKIFKNYEDEKKLRMLEKLK